MYIPLQASCCSIKTIGRKIAKDKTVGKKSLQQVLVLPKQPGWQGQ
jgi:hypothetical protein